MEDEDVWLMYHKAKLNEYSPMNVDGSEFILGVAVIPAKNKEEADHKFEQFLSGDNMVLIKLENCVIYNPDNFKEDSIANKQINFAAVKAIETGKVHYACGKTSEALAYNERMDDE